MERKCKNCNKSGKKEKSRGTVEKEFSHIEIKLVRSEEWLKKQHPFHLSEAFPLADFVLPKKFENMTEYDLEDLREWIVGRILKFLKLKNGEG